jgi:hypothetical protein
MSMMIYWAWQYTKPLNAESGASQTHKRMSLAVYQALGHWVCQYAKPRALAKPRRN